MQQIKLHEFEKSESKARKIAFTIAKGGQLKTTSVTNIIGAILKDDSLENARICVIDLDAQANVFIAFGLNADQLAKGQDLSAALLDGDVENTLFEIYRMSENRYVHSITANERCDLLEMILVSRANEFDDITQLLNNLVKKLEHYYDYIIFDTAPAYSVLISNVLCVEDIEIYVPFEPDTYSVRSVAKSIKSFEVFKKRNESAKFGGVFATKVRKNTNVHQTLIVQTKMFVEVSNKRYLNTEIKSSVKAASSILYNAIPSTLATKKAEIADDYLKLWEEIK